MTDWTHDPALKSWVVSANDPKSDFPIQNLPLGCFGVSHEAEPRLGTAIGDQILDLTAAFDVRSMQAVMAMTRRERIGLRHRISRFLSEYSQGAEGLLVDRNSASPVLPCEIGDYTDFFASLHHATNTGQMFRPNQPLLPNYKWVPVAYHGRASSIVISGTEIRRPSGQIADNPAGPPIFGPTRRLDYELELGIFIGPGNRMGEPIPID